MWLDFKEEEIIINTSEVSKKAWHLRLCDVEKLMTTISDLCRDRRLLSWGINNLPLSLHKPVCNFRDETALPEHVRSASCLDQRRLCQGASSWGEKGKPSPHFGDDDGVTKEKRNFFGYLFIWGMGSRERETVSVPGLTGLVSNTPREYGLMDNAQLSWSKQHDKDNCMIYI